MKRATNEPDGVRTPEIPARFIERPRLRADFDRGTAGAVTLVAAGPGSGKTAALAHWARTSRQPIAWLSVDRRHQAPQRFWSRVGDALFAVGAIEDARALDSLVHDADRPGEFLDELMGSLPSGPGAVLVVDDAHLLTDPVLLAELDDAIRLGSGRLRLVLSARSDPLLPLHRYRLAGALHEVRADALAMTKPEIRALLRAHGVSLRKGALDMLADRTEGWVGGVRLSAMSMAGSAAPEAFVAKLTIDQGSIGEYLVEEVLSRQPEPVRRLLIETSFLDEISGSLAAAVSGSPDAPALLAELARTNSFVLPVGREPDRYRYHPLLAEILRYLLQREGPAIGAALRRRAAAWHAADGDTATAIRFAVDARDWAHAASLLVGGGYARAVIDRRDPGDLLPPAAAALADEAVAGILARPDGDAASGDGTAQRGDAVVAAAIAALGAGRPAAAHARLALGRELGLSAAAESTGLLVDVALAQLESDPAALCAACADLLDGRRPGDGVRDLPGLRAVVLMTRSAGSLWDGTRHADAESALLGALGDAEAAGAVAAELEILGMLQLAYADAGRLQHARDCESRAQALLRRNPDLRRGALHYLALAQAAVLRADFAAAQRHVRRTEHSPRAQAEPPLRTAIAVVGARVAMARGALADAHQMLQRAAEPGLPLPAAVAERRALALADLETRFGRPNAALRLIREAALDPRQPAVAIAAARALGALGDAAAARSALRPALIAVDPTPPLPVVIQGLLASAWIATLQDDSARACEDILRAAQLAPPGLLEPFRAMGDALADIVARHADVAAAWPAAALPDPGPPTGGPDAPPARRRTLSSGLLHDPLTEREIAVLRRLATTMTTGEIAAELCVSVNTVKTHIAAVYRKLPASGRRDAVARARQIELL